MSEHRWSPETPGRGPLDQYHVVIQSPIRDSSRNVSNAGEQSFISQGLDILNLRSKKVGQMYIYADTGSTTAVFSQFSAERRASESSAMPEMPHTVRFTHTC
jgi:hypothetical protein